MAKEFYTEKDIEDLAARGVMSLQLTDSIVLTDLAYERARVLGVALITTADNPPAAPVRPYLSSTQPVMASAIPAVAPGVRLVGGVDANDLRQRIRSAVSARLGSTVDPALLEAIINRVLAGTGVK